MVCGVVNVHIHVVCVCGVFMVSVVWCMCIYMLGCLWCMHGLFGVLCVCAYTCGVCVWGGVYSRCLWCGVIYVHAVREEGVRTSAGAKARDHFEHMFKSRRPSHVCQLFPDKGSV